MEPKFASFTPFISGENTSNKINTGQDIQDDEGLNYFDDKTLLPNSYLDKFLNKDTKLNFSETIIPTKITPTKPQPMENITEKLTTSENIPKTDYATIPYNSIIGKIDNLKISEDKKDFLKIVGKQESGLRPDVVNTLGYMGLFQFGELAFKDTGYTRESFKNIDNQFAAALKLADLNEKRLLPIIQAFAGKVYNGINITKNGILAAAHNQGADTVKQYFGFKPKTKGQDFKDGYGTTIEKYFKLFG